MQRRIAGWMGAWLPVGLWAGLIYYGSTDVFAASRTSRFVRPLVLWIHPGASDNLVALVQTVARKGWHCTEYAILAACVWRAVGPRVSPGHRACLSWCWAVTYALSDEFHQSFIDGREGTVRDMGFDAAGAAAALLLLVAATVRTRRGPMPSGGG